jgi:anti-anti-sigma factor
MNGASTFHEPSIEVRSPQPDAALVVLAGEHDLSSANELLRTFHQSLAHCDHLIVDLSATEFIDVRTISVLMETRQHAIELDRKFSVVLGTEPIVERILEVSGVLPLLNVVPTVERALDASASPSVLVAHTH